jgi:hypothetical protein
VVKKREVGLDLITRMQEKQGRICFAPGAAYPPYRGLGPIEKQDRLKNNSKDEYCSHHQVWGRNKCVKLRGADARMVRVGAWVCLT